MFTWIENHWYAAPVWNIAFPSVISGWLPTNAIGFFNQHTYTHETLKHGSGLIVLKDWEMKNRKRLFMMTCFVPWKGAWI